MIKGGNFEKENITSETSETSETGNIVKIIKNIYLYISIFYLLSLSL